MAAALTHSSEHITESSAGACVGSSWVNAVDFSSWTPDYNHLSLDQKFQVKQLFFTIYTSSLSLCHRRHAINTVRVLPLVLLLTYLVGSFPGNPGGHTRVLPNLLTPI